jgi:hypothetical protein
VLYQITPEPKRPQSTVMRWPGKASEADCCSQGLSALVEHGYSMTWSARNRSVCGIVRPRAFAVFRLMTSSNLVGCSTGRSPGWLP